MMNENETRDWLAQHLSIIEDGLSLVDTEVRVPIPDGVGGRIDILAKDRFGTFVVIELKIAAPQSRTGLHELMKYLAALQAQRGLRQEKLRCIMLSTDWTDLLVPFSEHAHTSPFSFSGRKLIVDAAGVPTRSELVTLKPKSAGLVFPEEFSWIVFATREDRDRVGAEIERILSLIGLANVLALRTKTPRKQQYTFGLVLPFFLFSEAENKRVLEQTVFPVKLLEDYVDVTPEDDEDGILAHAVQHSLESELFCIDGVGSVSLCTHDIFAANLEHGWVVETIFRHGPLVADRRFLSDEDIVAALCGRGGASELYFVASVTPSHKMQWAAFRETAARLLCRYGDWRSVVDGALDSVAEQQETTVVISVYSPPSLARHAARFVVAGDANFLPSFDLLIAGQRGVVQHKGITAWDGVTAPATAEAAKARLERAGPLLLVADDDELTRDVAELYGFVFPVLSFDGNATKASRAFRTLAEWRTGHPGALNSLEAGLGRISVIE